MYLRIVLIDMLKIKETKLLYYGKETNPDEVKKITYTVLLSEVCLMGNILLKVWGKKRR